MGKTKIISETGSREIELPICFSQKVREDIAQKCYESEKSYQPFAPFFMAGKQASASGKIKRARKVWKSGYGHGMSRVPRKALWRRGTQFYWVAAEVASVRGGRRAHPPRVEHFQKELKINSNERTMGLFSGISSTASPEYVKKRYSSIDKINHNLPIVIESKMLELKSGKFIEALEKHLGNLAMFKEKRRRVGKGKMKLGSRIKPGMLIVIANDEKLKNARIDIKKVNELKMEDFWPLGRIVIYTEKAIKELGK